MTVPFGSDPFNYSLLLWIPTFVGMTMGRLDCSDLSDVLDEMDWVDGMAWGVGSI